MLVETRHAAHKDRQHGPAAKAAELLGIELGMFVRRTDNRHLLQKPPLSQLPKAERDAELARLVEIAGRVIKDAKTIEGESTVLEENLSDPDKPDIAR